MDVPYSELQPATLRALVEEFITRDGTDYGPREAGFETKVDQVMRQIQSGRIKIVFDAKTQSCDIREVLG